MGSIPGQGSHMLHSMAKSQTNKRQKTSQVSGSPPPPPPGDTEQRLDISGCHDSGKVLLASSGWRPGKQTNTPGHPAKQHRECSGPNAQSALAGSPWLDGHVIKVRTEPERADSPALAASHPRRAPRPPRSNSLFALSGFALGTSAKCVYNISPPW